MSASEKLKALDAPLPANLAEWGKEVQRRGAVFLDVLPQIVAVVEAAENVPMWPAAGTKLPRVALAQSLTALDEALS